MIRVVLDTNVLVSAILAPGGTPARIVSRVRDGTLQLVFSPATLGEIRSVLRYPKLTRLIAKRGLDPRAVEVLVKRLAALSHIVEGTQSVPAVAADPSDETFLSCAVEGQARYVVSGDRHLTNMKAVRGIPIVSPTRFLAILAEETP